MHHPAVVQAQLGVGDDLPAGVMDSTMPKVGGAITSGWPSARAASGSRYAGLSSPIASANSRIFSRPTSYGGVGG